jgi:hypothetical protein
MDSFATVINSLDSIVSEYDEILIMIAVCFTIHRVHAYHVSKNRRNERGTRLMKPKMSDRKRREINEILASDAADSSRTFVPTQLAKSSDLLSDASTEDESSENEKDCKAVDSDTDSDSSKSPRDAATPPWRMPKPEKKATESQVANATAQRFLLDFWNRSQIAPVDRAKQVQKMLASSNIALSATTYQLLADIGIRGNDLEWATEMSLKMENSTGTKLPQEMLDKMLDLYIFAGKKSTETSRSANTVQDEMVKILTQKPWYGNTKGQPQKHQICVGDSGMLFCLTMTGEATSPKFDNFALSWGGADGNTLYWGKSPSRISLGSTCAEIKNGSLVWNGDGSGSYGGRPWQWFASESRAVASACHW